MSGAHASALSASVWSGVPSPSVSVVEDSRASIVPSPSVSVGDATLPPPAVTSAPSLVPSPSESATVGLVPRTASSVSDKPSLSESAVKRTIRLAVFPS